MEDCQVTLLALGNMDVDSCLWLPQGLQFGSFTLDENSNLYAFETSDLQVCFDDLGRMSRMMLAILGYGSICTWLATNASSFFQHSGYPNSLDFNYKPDVKVGMISIVTANDGYGII